MNATPSTTNTQRNRSRWQLVAIVAVFVLPWVAAFLWTPPGRVNNGELIEPIITLPEMAMRDAAQQPMPFSSLQSQWILLTTASDACSQGCEQTLYTMRQVRLSLGKHAPRVRSVLLTRQPLADGDLSRYQEADPNLTILSPEASELTKADVLFQTQKKQDSGADGILLIDPNGNLMMRYTAGFEAKLIRKDLSRLLKASRIG